MPRLLIADTPAGPRIALQAAGDGWVTLTPAELADVAATAILFLNALREDDDDRSKIEACRREARGESGREVAAGEG